MISISHDLINRNFDKYCPRVHTFVWCI